MMTLNQLHRDTLVKIGAGNINRDDYDPDLRVDLVRMGLVWVTQDHKMELTEKGNQELAKIEHAKP